MLLGQNPRSLERDGYLCFPNLLYGAAVADDESTEFRRWWNDLPTDPYLPKSATYRQRRYGRVAVDVEERSAPVVELPWTPFRQAMDLIPLFGGRERCFAPTSSELSRNSLFRKIVLSDSTLISNVTGDRCFTVGVHLMRVLGDNGMVVPVTPEGRHRDGHRYVAIHLVDCLGYSGGRTTIFQGTAVARSVVLGPESRSLIIDDEKMEHEVEPLQITAEHGRRDTLILDFVSAPSPTRYAFDEKSFRRLTSSGTPGPSAL